MAILDVTVYKINGSYFPGGCEREISCSGIKTLQQNYSLAMPSGGPLDCDEDEPENVNTEIIQMPNGDKWWIGQSDPESIVERCSAAGCKDIFTSEDEDYEFTLSESCLVYKIAMKSASNPTIKIGTTEGGDEIMLETELTPGEWTIIADDIRPLNIVGPTLYFRGITSTTQINIYQEKI